MSGLKVIAGEQRGRSLRAPPGRATRPTSGKVRAALFNILGDVAGARVLDLYAGSGALGIEALSRGAAEAVFVESGRAAATCIRDNLRDLALETRARLLQVRVEDARSLLSSHGKFELIVCDPPWADVEGAEHELRDWLLELCLERGGRLVLEHAAANAELDFPNLELVTRRTWGDTGMSIFSRPES